MAQKDDAESSLALMRELHMLGETCCRQVDARDFQSARQAIQSFDKRHGIEEPKSSLRTVK